MEVAKRVFQGIYRDIWERRPLKMEKLESDKTALIIMDMVNGFVKEGELSNPLAEEIIPPIISLMRRCKEKQIPVIAFADTHPEDSPEFQSYPKHCVKDTEETEIVEEIKAEDGYTLIPKNSTNGMLEEAFQRFIDSNPQITNFIVTGVCTDICVMQFSMTLKAWFNKENRASRVIIPLDSVETFDYRAHQITLVNTMAIYFMEEAGMEIVGSII